MHRFSDFRILFTFFFFFLISNFRQFILEYFGSNAGHLKSRPKCCDNCDRGISSVKLSNTYTNVDDDGFHDFTKNALLLLKAMRLTNNAKVAANVLKGSEEKKAFEFRKSEFYGVGKLMPKDYWNSLVSQLINDKLLYKKKLESAYMIKIVMSPKGEKWMKTQPTEPLILKAIPKMYEFFEKKRKATLINNNNIKYDGGECSKVVATTSAAPTPVPSAEVEIEDEAIRLNDVHLESILKSVRAEIAERNNCVPFAVATDVAIKQMVDKKPISIKEFIAAIIDGFSVVRIEKFGEIFVKTISMFMVSRFDLTGMRIKSLMFNSFSFRKLNFPSTAYFENFP